MAEKKAGMIVILSSPSGAGKTTLVRKISLRNNFKISISHTTRKPRVNEKNGRDYFFIKNKEIEALTAEWTNKAELENIEKVKTEEQIQLIRNEDRKAEEVYKWVQGSKQIQPLALSIARSMGQKSSIEELLLYREEKNPHQIRIQLKFINGGQKQLDTTLSAINSIGYRAYSANQNLIQGGKVDYQATLIWQDNNYITNELTLNHE